MKFKQVEIPSRRRAAANPNGSVAGMCRWATITMALACVPAVSP
ncbi:hypothetical protein [Natrinema pellirubrum]|nr:hypothetical protein [Natrinema pellirubrum]